MAFGYEYWMVYLPEFRAESFLLFVHNPAGSTKLRDYSGGREQVLGQPSLADVRQATEWGRTRFEEAPHTVSGRDGESHWGSRIAEYNRRYLSSLTNGNGNVRIASPLPSGKVEMNRTGRAQRGSQRQLQDYVNLIPSLLDDAVLSALPMKIQQGFPRINWVSPLATDQFREFRDEEFLSAVGLGRYSKDLRAFWPKFGPCWDALGLLTTSLSQSVPVVVLVEAKSHVQEVYGNGCQAGGASRALIEKSLHAAKIWCGTRSNADWTGPLYQFANRIAHLYFMRQRITRPCFLVHLYFVDDPFRPTSQTEWQAALNAIHQELGLTKPVPGWIEVFLPGRVAQDEQKKSQNGVEVCTARSAPCGASERETTSPPAVGTLGQAVPLSSASSFAMWGRQWEMLGTFRGPILPDAEDRIRRVRELWQQDIPGQWERSVDAQLLGNRYRRGDLQDPHPGEHSIEYQILVERFGKVKLLGGGLIDGVNALPLACDFAQGGRHGNVEADMLLTIESTDGFRLVLCEVKADANDPWYAAVELSRQMRLFISNPVGRTVMERRGGLRSNLAEVPLTGLVLAPADYYRARGKKGNAVAPANRLFAEMRRHHGIDMRLAVWDPALNSICLLP